MPMKRSPKMMVTPRNESASFIGKWIMPYWKWAWERKSTTNANRVTINLQAYGDPNGTYLHMVRSESVRRCLSTYRGYQFCNNCRDSWYESLVLYCVYGNCRSLNRKKEVQETGWVFLHRMEISFFFSQLSIKTSDSVLSFAYTITEPSLSVNYSTIPTGVKFRQKL